MGRASSLAAISDGPIGSAISQHHLAASIVVYVVVAIPVYFWLEGPVGIEGTVDGSVAAIGLALGAILFVPVIRGVIRRNVGEGESARLGITGADPD